MNANTERAIDFCEREANARRKGSSVQIIMETVLSALRAQAERENPKPLTLDELRERNGKPVWIEYSGNKSASEWEILSNPAIDEYYDDVCFEGGDCVAICENGLSWRAYDYPPKEADT